MSRVLWCVAARGALLMVAMGSALLMLFANGADVSAAPAIKLTQVYSGFTQPVFMAQPPDGTNRLFVVERAGRIRLIVNGVHQSTPFLDLQSQITSAGEEQGMLGLAFHPNFRANRRFYVYYTDAQGNDTLARYEASTTNPNVASLTTRTILFSFPDRYDNHNGGMLALVVTGCCTSASAMRAAAAIPATMPRISIPLSARSCA